MNKKLDYQAYKTAADFEYIKKVALLYTPQQVDKDFFKKIETLNQTDYLNFLSHVVNSSSDNSLKTQWSIQIIERLCLKEKNSNNKDINEYIVKLLSNEQLFSPDLLIWASTYLHEQNHSFQLDKAIVKRVVENMTKLKESYSFHSLNERHDIYRKAFLNLLSHKQIDIDNLIQKHEKELFSEIYQYCFKYKHKSQTGIEKIKLTLEQDPIAKLLDTSKILEIYLKEFVVPNLIGALGSRQNISEFLKHAQANPVPIVIKDFRDIVRFYRHHFKSYDLTQILQKNKFFQRSLLLSYMLLTSFSNEENLLKNLASNYGDGKLLDNKNLKAIQQEHFSHLNLKKWARIFEAETKSLQATFRFTPTQHIHICELAKNAYDTLTKNRASSAQKEQELQASTDKMMLDLFLDTSAIPQSTIKAKKIKI